MVASASRSVEPYEGGHVEVGEDVAVADQEPARDAAGLGGEADRPGGAERFRLRRHLEGQVRERPPGEGVGPVAEGEDDLGDAVPGQPRQLMFEERPVDDREQRLRRGPGEGPETRALAPGQDDGLHGRRSY